MKRIFLGALVALLPLSANAIDYNDARQQAYYLTDKMAYELNLSPEQYEYVYQINLDYFLSVSSWRDVNSTYWNYRNIDLQYVLDSWQYSQFMAIDYFLRPIVWRQSAWYFPVVNHYSNNFYYFSHPNFYSSYQGRTWQGRVNTAPSPYRGMVVNHTYGMRDRYRDNYSYSSHSYQNRDWNRNRNTGTGRSQAIGSPTDGRYYENRNNAPTQRHQEQSSHQSSSRNNQQEGRTYRGNDNNYSRQQTAPSRPSNRQQSAPSNSNRQSPATTTQQSTNRSSGRTFGR